MTLQHIYFACETGKRKNMEDSIWPAPHTADTGNRIFLVCDGVGGSNKGEVASQLVAGAVAETLQTGQPTGIDSVQVEAAVAAAIEQMAGHVLLHPDAAEMATTFTIAAINENNVLLGWCGDSRIMHIRNGRVLYQTQDHSLVQQMIHSGLLQPNEAVNHPNRNIILRSINARALNSQVDFFTLYNVLPGDWLLLCTDGLLETLTEAAIPQIFDNSNDPGSIQQAILNNAAGQTNDNYSYYLLQF